MKRLKFEGCSDDTFAKLETEVSINEKYNYEINLSRLKELRISRNLTMEKLGKDIGVTRSTISNLENDQRRPSLDMVIKLAEYFQVSIDYIVGRADDSTFGR